LLFECHLIDLNTGAFINNASFFVSQYMVVAVYCQKYYHATKIVQQIFPSAIIEIAFAFFRFNELGYFSEHNKIFLLKFSILPNSNVFGF
jgi:hypothetical protein